MSWSAGNSHAPEFHASLRCKSEPCEQIISTSLRSSNSFPRVTFKDILSSFKQNTFAHTASPLPHGKGRLLPISHLPITLVRKQGLSYSQYQLPRDQGGPSIPILSSQPSAPGSSLCTPPWAVPKHRVHRVPTKEGKGQRNVTHLALLAP